jgi:CRISPR-associated protein Cmr4
MNAQLTFVHALSSLHAGTGQGVGVIDLPIAREKATGIPFLPGSSLKGSLRARCNMKECIDVFGPETSDISSDSNQASAAQFSDHKLLLLPVRSLAGTFAWVTSPYVLRRFVRDMQDVSINPPAVIPQITEMAGCFIAEDSKIKLNSSPTMVYLEDLDLQPQADQDQSATLWATWLGQQIFPEDTDWQQMLVERFCIVHDDVFNFIIDSATEITARIKLKEGTKTVQDGGLWYEEALPSETILSGLVLANPVKAANITAEKVFDILTDLTVQTIQLGGKATVGRGMCRIQMVKGGA